MAVIEGMSLREQNIRVAAEKFNDFPVEPAFISAEFFLPFSVSDSGLKLLQKKARNRPIVAEDLAEFLQLHCGSNISAQVVISATLPAHMHALSHD